MAQYKEGQRLQGSDGQIYVVHNGVPVLPNSIPSAPQMPADPTFPLQAPKVQAEIGNAVANAQGQQIDNRVAGATVGAQITSANADATAKTRTAQTAGLPEGFMWGADGRTAVPIPGYTRQGLSPEIRSQAIQAYSDADALERAADQLEQLYRQGPGATHGLRGLQDYLPTTGNKIFNDAGQQARGYVKRALGFTGGEGNTVTESSALYDPYLPSASDRDEQIVAKIAKLRALANDSLKKSTLTLGGVPDENGAIRPNAMTMQRVVSGGDPLQAAAFGATTGITDQYPPEMVAAHGQLVLKLLAEGGGKLDPQAYAQERARLNQQFGFAGDPQADMAWASGINEYVAKGGKSVPSDITPAERDLTTTEAIRNSIANNPVAATGINAADMAFMGGISLLDNATGGGRMDALNEANPISSTVGQIGGAITGASLLGGAGAFAAGKIAPQLLGGGAKAALARQAGTDAIYSGFVGANQGGNPLEAAAWGLGGTLAGRAAGKALGGAVGGITQSAPVRALRASGIPLTVGQTLGGFAKGLEDKATSIPLVGDIINARRLEGLQAFNRQAFNDAGAPVGAKVNEIGQTGTEALFDQIGNSYDSATQGVNVPLDGQYAQDFAGVIGRGQSLPDDLRLKFGKALENRVNPINDAGFMTGDSYQQAQRGLKSYKAEVTKPGFEQDYRDSISAAQDVLKNQMLRGGGQSVVDGLGRADAAYRSAKTIEDAVGRAKGGSMSGELYTFTPSQLQGAVAKTKGKFPGAHPLEALANDGQAVLPSRVPDSGTAGRVAQMALPGGLVAGGAGVGALAGGQDGAQDGAINSAILAGILMAGGTKTGQKAIVKALADRPDAVRRAGRKISKNKGLFGRAMIPFTLEN